MAYKKVNFRCSDFEGCEQSQEFFDNHIWGKGGILVKAMELCISEYGVVPTNRDAVKAFEIWLDGQLKKRANSHQ